MNPRIRHTSSGDQPRPVFDDIRRLADRSQDAIYHYAMDSRRFLFFNKRFAEFFQLGDTVRGTASIERVFRSMHPDDRQHLVSAFERSLKNGRGKGEIEYRIRRPDGTVRWLHDRWITVQEVRGWAIEGFIRDITEMRTADHQFELSKENAPIGSYIVQDRRFKYVNPEFIRITGYTQAELLESDPLDYVHEEYRNHVQQAAVAMLKGGASAPYEFCIIDKTGDVRWIMETVTSVEYRGKRAVLGYFMDITGLRRIQDNLSNLGLMIGTISHSLKGCLTGLDAGMYLIESGFYRNRPARIEEGLDVAKLMADRIRRLVFDILYYAKERELQLEAISVRRFAQDTAASIETRIRAADISFACNLGGDLGRFSVDAEILRPAMLNILENAMEACIEDSRDKPHRIDFTVSGDRDRIRFTVSDNAAGIEQERLDRIFRLFYSSKGNQGTGIGLFITRQVILKHGGRITVNAEPGRGCLFEMTIPRIPRCLAG